ncbi:hypothetical protein BJ944DRAFT_33447 [Cunninghamella echinulata]|nr:hypothetical protein BJ944DRAFT_33447 [Cunninghamella echinulata]
MFHSSAQPVLSKKDFEKFLDEYSKSRLPARCCGCFPNRLGSALGSIIMSGFSFYFAVLSFMQISPFFSTLPQAPLIVFGVLNLLFGLVTLFAFIMTLITRKWFDRHVVYILGAFCAMVVIDALVNVVIFSSNRNAFQQWCISDGLSQVKANLDPSTSITLAPDYYNCDRLFNDEIKWSLICVILMFLIYAHWTVFIAHFIGKKFIPFITPTPITEPIPALNSIVYK